MQTKLQTDFFFLIFLFVCLILSCKTGNKKLSMEETIRKQFQVFDISIGFLMALTLTVFIIRIKITFI